MLFFVWLPGPTIVEGQVHCREVLDQEASPWVVAPPSLRVALELEGDDSLDLPLETPLAKRKGSIGDWAWVVLAIDPGQGLGLGREVLGIALVFDS